MTLFSVSSKRSKSKEVCLWIYTYVMKLHFEKQGNNKHKNQGSGYLLGGERPMK